MGGVWCRKLSVLIYFFIWEFVVFLVLVVFFFNVVKVWDLVVVLILFLNKLIISIISIVVSINVKFKVFLVLLMDELDLRNDK